MAKVIEEAIVIKVSKLVKDDTNESLVPEDVLKALESVAEELLGKGVVVEVEKELLDDLEYYLHYYFESCCWMLQTTY